jgi:hypothetical protein
MRGPAPDHQESHCRVHPKAGLQVGIFNKILKRLSILKGLKGQCYTIGITHFLAKDIHSDLGHDFFLFFYFFLFFWKSLVTDSLLKPSSSLSAMPPSTKINGKKLKLYLSCDSYWNYLIALNARMEFSVR